MKILRHIRFTHNRFNQPLQFKLIILYVSNLFPVSRGARPVSRLAWKLTNTDKSSAKNADVSGTYLQVNYWCPTNKISAFPPTKVQVKFSTLHSFVGRQLVCTLGLNCALLIKTFNIKILSK